MQQDFNQLITWSKQFDLLPWRQNRSLYRTLVSEIMLQQTTVATVVNKFEGFLTLYPTISHLAQATEQEILIAWKGLGYYRRAKNLLAAAKHIQTYHAGIIPIDYLSLVTIPGIGNYTANAILSIGDDQKVLAVDTNLERVIARYYGLDVEKGVKLKKTILDLFHSNKIFKADLSFRLLNEALMDLGREYCTKSKTKCFECPLQANCKSVSDPLARPIVTKKQRITYDLALLRVLIIDKDQLMAYQKSDSEWLAGQWECPTFILEDCDNLKQYPCLKHDYKNLPSFKTTITKYKITNYILDLTIEEFSQLFIWDRKLHPIALSTNSNFSTATQKALHCLSSLQAC